MPDLTRVSTKQILSTLAAISGKLQSALPYAPDYEKSRIIGGKHALTLPQVANDVNIDRDRLSACLSERKNENCIKTISSCPRIIELLSTVNFVKIQFMIDTEFQ